jgi:hypothetical protein
VKTELGVLKAYLPMVSKGEMKQNCQGLIQQHEEMIYLISKCAKMLLTKEKEIERENLRLGL